jgi:hypothetical protein
MTMDRYLQELKRVGGAVGYNANTTHMGKPEQVMPTNIGNSLSDLLKMQMSLINDVSGIHGAIQGKTANSGVSGRLYQQETANASLNTTDVIQTYSSFIEQRNRKVLKVIQQYYVDKRPIVTFDWHGKRETFYDPEAVKDADADIKVIQSNDTPVYRAAQDEMIMEWAKMQLIPPAVALKVLSMPQAKEILATMEQEAQAQQAQSPEQ